MTTYYLSSVDGDNGSDGLSWANAFATFKYAVETVSAVASGPHTLLVDSATADIIAADTTVTAAGDINVLCVNRSTGALAEMDRTNSYIGHSTTSYSITLAGAYTVYLYGLAFRFGGSTAKSLSVAYTDGSKYIFENCKLDAGTNNTSSRLNLGVGGTSAITSAVALHNCTLRFNNTGARITVLSSNPVITNLTIDSGGSAPSVLINTGGSYGAGSLIVAGADLSLISGTLITDNNSGCLPPVVFVNCKLHASVTPLATQTFTNGAGASVYLYNCNSGDVHYSIAHYDALGKTVVSAATYCNDNIADTDLSWYIESTAYATFYNPYVSPWIDVYNDDVSTSVTPYLEGLRASDSDSACDTVAQDDEIWSEWSVQDTSSYPLGVTYSDRMTLLGTAADQTSAKATTDWTIAAANDAYKSCFKLACPSAVTPNEVGHVRARVCVGIASKGFFVDPQIRGLA